MIPINKDCISSATKRWVQGLQAFIQVDFNQLFAWVFDKGIDKVGIALGH